MKLFPVDAPRFTAPVSVRVTFPDVLAVSVPAFVLTLTAPEPDVRVRDGVNTLPAVASMAPTSLAFRVADVPALRLASTVIEPPELVEILRVLPAVIDPTVALPFNWLSVKLLAALPVMCEV